MAIYMYYARFSTNIYIYIISFYMITYTVVILCLHIFTRVFTCIYLPVIILYKLLQ